MASADGLQGRRQARYAPYVWILDDGIPSPIMIVASFGWYGRVGD
jgi:hypothetical protein